MCGSTGRPTRTTRYDPMSVELNIADIFEALALAYPDRDALIFRDRTLSYRDVAARSRRLAGAMSVAGMGRPRQSEPSEGWISPHRHVALYMYNGNEYLESMLAAYMARSSPVNVNYRYRADELVHVLADSRSRGIIFHSRFAPLLAEIRPRLPLLSWLCQVADDTDAPLLDGARWYHELVADEQPPAPTERSGTDRYLCYTGGTTGAPKGVLWRQSDFLVAALGVRHRDGSPYESMEELVGAAEGSRLRALPTAPFMHGAAHWNAISCWVSGGTVICQSHPEHLDADDVWSTVERHRATSLLIVGDSFAVPLLDGLATSDHDVSSLRHVLSGGAVLSPAVRRRLLSAIPGVSLVDVLGSSESGRQGVSRIADDSRADAGFRPSATAVIVSDDRTRCLDRADGSIGWLAQTGRVPLGYLGDPDASAATFPTIDGVRYAIAGDRARYGSDGDVVLLGRESVCINTGGEKVFAEEVEVALTSHPAVLDAVVCGRPSDRWGQEVAAVISLAGGADPTDDELVSHCKGQLASFKAPRSIHRVPVVMRSPSGKADYRWARAVVTARPADP